MNVFKFGEGYRTYVIVGALVLAVLAEKFLGFDVPGVTVGEDWMKELGVLLGFATVHAAVVK